MPVSVELRDDGYVLYYKLSDPLEIPDLMEAYKTEQRLRDSVDHVVHSISDFSGVRRIPKNWLQAKAGPGLKHPRSGEMLLVGMSQGLTILVNTILRITNYKRVKLFKTMDEAQQYIGGVVAQTKAGASESQPAKAGDGSK